MIDVNIIRKDPQSVKEKIRNRGYDPKLVDDFLRYDEEKRKLSQKVQELQSERNKISSTGKKPTLEEIEKVKQIKIELSNIECELNEVITKWQEKLDWIPNLYRDDTPIGNGEDDNIDVYAYVPNIGEIDFKELGKPYASKKFMPETPPHSNVKFQGKHHLDIGRNLDIIDNEQSAKTSGSRFTYLKGDLVLMQYAIFEFLKDRLIKENFTPMVVPLLLRERALYGTSHFPEGRSQVYGMETDNVEENTQLFLIGSSEPSLFAYYMDKNIDIKKLPIKMFAYTSCFRSESGSWGKDTRGIKRVHQFDKLEMDLICHPDESNYYAEEYLLGINKWFLQELDLPFRIVHKCSKDMGYGASHAQWDFDYWLPSSNEFMEGGTSTNATDYQARRLNITFRDVDGKNKLVHTVNDTGIAIGRCLIAIIDNYQQPEGSILIPKVLQKYIGKESISLSK